MKNNIISIIGVALLATGCQFADRVGSVIYEPVVGEETVEQTMVVQVPEVIEVNGNVLTNWVERLEVRPVTVVSTNSWRLNPAIGDGVRMFGDIAPFPWAGTLATLLLTGLGLGAHAMGRKWRKVATEGVQFGMDVRDVLKKHNAKAADEIKASASRRQRANGTKDLVDGIISNLK